MVIYSTTKIVRTPTRKRKRSGLFLFLALLLVAPLAQAGEWTDLSANIPEKVNLTDVHFIGGAIKSESKPMPP